MGRTVFRQKKDLANTLARLCDEAGLPPHHGEFQFHVKRRWRFDLAWPERKLGVEVHGGTWMRGGHNRGKGMARDAEKARAAVLHGWRVLPFTNLDMETPGMCVEQIRAALFGLGVEFPVRERLR